MKKVNGSLSEDHYSRFNAITGEVISLQPEYITMSRRPGIGSSWFDKYRSDVYPSDEVILRGKRMRPPRFYDERYKALDPLSFEQLQFDRFLEAQKHIDNFTSERLSVREECVLSRISKLVRSLEP